VPKFIDNGVAAVLVNDWQISGVYRWNSGRPYSIGATVSGFDLTGGTNVGARPVLTCDPGSGSSSDPYRQFNTGCFQAPSMGSKGDESARYFMHMPAINNVDMSLSKSFRFYRSMRFEIRADAFNALNHTQFTTINSTANFAAPAAPSSPTCRTTRRSAGQQERVRRHQRASPRRGRSSSSRGSPSRDRTDSLGGRGPSGTRPLLFSFGTGRRATGPWRLAPPARRSKQRDGPDGPEARCPRSDARNPRRFPLP
jgi:hypothetical protein